MHRPSLDEKLIQIKDNFCLNASTSKFLPLLFRNLLCFKAKTTVTIGNELCTNKYCCQGCGFLEKLAKCVATLWDSLEC